jgi:amino acid adenylation domain-containing protein
MTHPYPLNLVDYLEYGAVLATPDRVCFRDQERTYTLTQIRRSARRIGAAIAERADVVNRPVAVCLPKCAETLIADLGIFYSGNFYLNVDIQAPAVRLQALLKNVDPSLYLTMPAHRAFLVALGIAEDRIFDLAPCLVADAPDPDAGLLDARRKRVMDTDPACIINTSGSTGIPKSAVLSHRGLIDFMEWHQRIYPLTPDDVIGSLSPYHFDGYIVGFFSAIWQGAQLVVVPGQLAMFPPRLAEFLRDQGITFIFWVPTVMVNMANADVFAVACPAALRHVGFAGEVFPTRHLNYWRRHLPQARFVNYYGPIEISVICTHYEVKRNFTDEETLPIGFACENTDILILDEDNRVCARGAQGELCVRGCSLADGYWNNPEATARAFVQNPLNPNFPEKIYRTGDLVFLNEHGEIMFVGRKDFQIKHQGFRIELGEIENACLAVPGLRNACVLYHRERKEITLFYEADAEVAPALIRTELARSLPKYMLPTVFHRLAALPLNPNGKIDRKALVDRLQAGV